MSYTPTIELREAAVEKYKTCVLVIDVQNYCCKKEGGQFQGKLAKAPSEYYWSAVNNCLGTIAELLKSARNAQMEVIYTVIESLTKDGRDRSKDYKISGFNIPRGSWDAKVCDEVTPMNDEIVLSKSSCSVFVSTNIAYILRNLGCEQLIICGGLTDQCVESAVRDACDLGFLVTLVTDASYTETVERQVSSLRALKGFCRQRTSAQVIQEMKSLVSTITLDGDDDEKEKRINHILNQVRYVRFELTDLNGKSLSKVVPARHARSDKVYFYSGSMAIGANAQVLTFPEEVESVGCPNWQALPQWDTLAILPYAKTSNDNGVARVLCEMPKCPAVPRTICRRMLDELKNKYNLSFLSACEYEFSVAKRDLTSGEWTPAFLGVDIFATLQFSKIQDLAYAIEEQLYKIDIDVKTLNCEYGAGQLEITYGPKFGIEAVDTAATFKLAVKEIALSKQLHASFLSKPFTSNEVGNGGHFNFSLWQNAENITADKTAHTLSPLSKRFVDGILFHARAIEAFCAPTPACYLRHGHWAPTHSDWGFDDRQSSIRVKLSQENSYLELRLPSASSCPYLVCAATIAAGMHGLEDPDAIVVPAVPSRAVLTTPQPEIPTSLPDALKVLEQDTYIVNKLGPDFVRWFTLLKRGELESIQSWVEADDISVEAAWQKMYMEFL
mmetsp:Transcript_2233/g.3512  ORF Transcript_2233/g.3512 Transcript_2233/m.3512 type:complete len:669 (+) Transcript_2233:51-2057(+)